jgi:transposase
LAGQIKSHTEEGGFAPLTEMCGVSWLLAGKIAGLLGPGCRFRTEAELAAYAGVAPLEASSASVLRHRLNRGGNRQLNSLLHQVAVTQLRCHDPAKTYVKRRLSEGKSKREAIRALKRYLLRAVWQAWRRCLNPPSTPVSTAT